TVIGGTVTSGTVVGGTVTWGTVTDGTVTWGTVTDGTVTWGTVTDGAVTWDTVTVGTVTWGTAIGGTVASGTVTGGTVTGGSCMTGVAANVVSTRTGNVGGLTPTPATEPVGGVGRAAGEPGNGSAVADCPGVRPPTVGTVGGGSSSLGPPSTIDPSPGSVRGPPGCVACVFCSTVAATLLMPVAAWEASLPSSKGVVATTTLTPIVASQPRLTTPAPAPPETAAVAAPAAVISAHGGVRDRSDALMSSSSAIAALQAGQPSR